MKISIWVAALAASLLAPQVSSAAEFDIEATTANGQAPAVLLAARPGPLGAVVIAFRTGSFDDGDKHGLSRIAAHALIESNRRMPYESFRRDMVSADADLVLETGIQESAIVFRASGPAFEALARKLIAACLAPELDSNTFSAAKSRATQEELDPSSGTTLASFVAATVFHDARFTNPPYGDTDGLDAVDASDVHTFLRKFMNPANATVVVTGNFQAASMKHFVSQFRGGARRTIARPSDEVPGVYLLRSPYELHIVGLPVTLGNAENVAATRLLSAILEERIFGSFRKRGLVYSTSATPMHREWLDFVMLVLPINPKSGPEARKLLSEELDGLHQGKLEPEEFERNKKHLLADMKSIDRNAIALANVLAEGGDSPWFDGQVTRQIEEMDQAHFLKVVSPWLDHDRMMHVVLSQNVQTGGKQ